MIRKFTSRANFHIANVLLALSLEGANAQAEPEKKAAKPLTAIEARKNIGEMITVQIEVKAAKDRLEKRGEIYLDAEENFRDEKNFAVVINRDGAASLKEAGIANPADHFNGKVIRATGKVTEVDKVPRIEISDAKQIKIVQEK